MLGKDALLRVLTDRDILYFWCGDPFVRFTRQLRGIHMVNHSHFLFLFCDEAS